MSAPPEGGTLVARLWASRWPEAAWLVFGAGNLAWMVAVPDWSMLPFHFIWVSLLLLYGLGYRTASRALALAPYDELIELPVMLLLFAITGLTNQPPQSRPGRAR